MYGGGMHMVNGTIGETQYVQVAAAKTTVRAFVIDQYEVTAAQAALFLNAHGNVCEGLDQKQNPGDVPICVWIEPKVAGIEKVDGRFVARRGQEQVREPYFSWEGAVRYCAWVGKRVPSSAQWEYAARHDPATKRDLIYPWGDTWLPHAATCNAKPCDPHPPGATPLEFERLRVGAYDGTHGRLDSSSPWGLHDTAGGGSEHVFDCADPNDTCETGAPCRCKALTTPSDTAPGIERLRLDHRVDYTAQGFGVAAVRCAVLAPG